jgi:peptide/nickel transport system substrate-binding protein
MRRFLAVLLTCAAACGGADADRGPVGGTIIIAAAADADAMLPPLVRSSQGRLASELLFDPLVVIGPSRNTVGDTDFAPRLASSWSWAADSLAITFALAPEARWHDGTPVTASDVIAGLAAIRDPANGSSLRSDLVDIDSISVADDHTLTLHYARRSPEQFYAASLIYPLPAHLLPTDSGTTLATSVLARRPVGNGPYRFVAWTPLERFELAAVDDHYRGRPRPDRVVVTVTPEPATGLARIWAGEADVWEQLPAGDLDEAARHPHVRIISSSGFAYAYAAFNFQDARDRTKPHPLFTDRALRRAISMAVDRHELVRAVFDSLAYPLLGPFVRAQFTADTTIQQIAPDRAAAAALLDSLGWRLDPRDGIRRRGSQRLAFSALVPGSSRTREQAAVLMQEQLRQVGIEMQIDRVENNTFMARRQEGAFDVVFGGWLTTPSPRGLRSTWGSVAHEGWGAQNDGRYTNPEFDAAVEAGLNAMDREASRAHFRRAYQTIVDDAAALFLYEARMMSAVHARFRMPPWRPDGWWRTIPEWTVEPAERLPRDTRPAAN